MLKKTRPRKTLMNIRITLILLGSLLLLEASASAPLPGTEFPPGTSPQINPLVATAYQHLQQNDPTSARALYMDALQQEPGNRDALLGLTTVAMLLNDPGLALHYLKMRLGQAPEDPQALAGWFDLTANNGAHENHLQQLLNLHPEISGLHFALGNVYARQSRWSEAQRSYENACRLDPANPAFNFNLAVSLDHLGEIQAATRYYRESIRLNPYHHAGIDAAASARLREIPWP